MPGATIVWTVFIVSFATTLHLSNKLSSFLSSWMSSSLFLMGVKPHQCWCLCTKGCRVLVKSSQASDVLFLSWALWQQEGQKFNFELASKEAKKNFSISWFSDWTRPLEYYILYSWGNSNNLSVHFSKQFCLTVKFSSRPDSPQICLPLELKMSTTELLVSVNQIFFFFLMEEAENWWWKTDDVFSL